MNWLLILILSLITISIVILLIGIFKNDENITFFGGIAIFLIGLIGLLFVGVTVNMEKRISKVDGVFSKNTKAIIIDDNNKLYYFDKKIDFDNITDTTTFYLKLGYNMYYTPTDYQKVYYKIEDDIFDGIIINKD